MNNKKIAVGWDSAHWHDKFADALKAKINQNYPLEYQVLNLDAHDWLDVLTPYEMVIWKPANMGVESACYFKEKVYFLEKYLGKVVVPNYDTIWHFESKIAQSYLFALNGIPVPRTTVSFDYHDAHLQLEKTVMPLVVKKSHGAGSSNVRLITRFDDVEQALQINFCQQLWDEHKLKISGKYRKLIYGLVHPWFWAKIRHNLLQEERFGAVLWQEFIPDNSADLRITVIGDRYAFGFWRNNRPGDFRASGSGRIDYQRSIPREPLRYCLDINRKLNFDSMAYDILFMQDGFVVTEISYAYVDRAIYNSTGYYRMGEKDEIKFVEGHTWPQELWVEWALSRANR